MGDIINVGTPHSNGPSKNISRASHIHSSMDAKKSTNSNSSLNKRRVTLLPSDLSDIHSSNKSSRTERYFRQTKTKESHPAWLV